MQLICEYKPSRFIYSMLQCDALLWRTISPKTAISRRFFLQNQTFLILNHLRPKALNTLSFPIPLISSRTLSVNLQTRHAIKFQKRSYSIIKNIRHHVSNLLWKAWFSRLQFKIEVCIFIIFSIIYLFCPSVCLSGYKRKDLEILFHGLYAR